jgi:hypothetical protein
MKTKLMALLLVAGGSLLAETHVSIGVRVGAPPVYGYATPVVAYRPPCPGPGYVWIAGYYDGYGRWFDGYWTLPPYTGAYWVAPRLFGGRFVAGYWGGARHFDRHDYRRDDRDWRRHDDRGWRRDYDRHRDDDRGRDRHDRDRDRRR